MRHVVLLTVLASVVSSAITAVLLSVFFFGASAAQSVDYSAQNEPAAVALVGGLAQGDVDCSTGVGAADALKVLRYVAGLPYAQTEPCTDIGALLEVGGYERVTVAGSKTDAGPLFTTVNCPAGKRVFGGGVRRTSGTLSGLSWAVLESYPGTNQTSWSVLLHQTDAGTRNYEFSAVCAPASP